MTCRIRTILGIIALAFFPQLMWGQNRVMSDCFSALHVQIPWYSETKDQGANEMSKTPSIQYFAEDQFTFWYSLSAMEDGMLSFAVWPTNTTDVFQANVYRHYTDTTFCRKLVHGEVQAESVLESMIVGDMDAAQLTAHSYELEIEAGATYFVSVLSLKPDFCGHRMDFNFNAQRLHFNILNRPCFNFTAIEEIDEIDFIDAEPATIEIEVATKPEIVLLNQNSTEETAPAEIVEEETVEDTANAEVEVKMADMKIEVGSTLKLEEIYFYNNTYAFRQESAGQLEELLKLMKDYPELEIEIGGHTAGNTRRIKPDPNLADRGDAWNFKGNSRKLSKMRAEAVKKYLVDRGVSGKRVKTQGYADDEKIVENPVTPDDHRRNMRVEIAITTGLNEQEK